ncbi:hypothetical protein Vadar_005057 [Vaccinium darrowii]|uniref:Uncharacterized protein n=1 Tax=Vaccinium darrowii TaxID=229202 RepID=A0ACB7XPP6_9ERIC|nr:hypothetical protein Vadar_005057 [Vaccinium darrowii]
MGQSGNGNGGEKLDKGSAKSLGLERGFEIFKQMSIDKVAPNEATFTSLARLTLAKEDPEMAFDLVKKMKGCGVVPKLRSYGPKNLVLLKPILMGNRNSSVPRF